MATITALHFDSYGPLSSVYSKTIPKPTIEKPTQILVKVKAAAAHPADALFVSGNYNQKAKSFPSRAGFEGAGVVEEKGSEASVNVGQRIHFISLGSWAEYVIVDTATNPPVPIPDNLSFEDAAQLTINPLSAVGMLDMLNPQQGKYLVQNAASSALGRIVIQLAKAQGIKTINVVRRDEHIEPLKTIGADFVINSEKEDVIKRIYEITPEGAHYALDAVGGKGGSDLVKSLAEDGILLNYGVLSGFILDVDISALLFKSLTVKGFYLYKWTGNRGAEIKKDYERIINSILTHKLALPVQTFDGKTKFAEALKHSQTPGKAEKTILLF